MPIETDKGPGGVDASYGPRETMEDRAFDPLQQYGKGYKIGLDGPITGSGASGSPNEGDVLTFEGGEVKWVSRSEFVSSALPDISFAPTTTPDVHNTVEDTFISGNVLTNDSTITGKMYIVSYRVPTISNPTGNTYTAGLESVTNPAGRFIMRANGSWELTPRNNVDFNLPLITYTVSNGLSTSTGTLKINISPVNDAPVLGNDVLTGLPDNEITVFVLGNDFDIEGNPMNITKLNGIATSPGGSQTLTNATVQLNTNNTITITPNTGYTGPVSFTYSVSDGLLETTGNVYVTFTVPSGGGGTSNYVVSTTTTIPFNWAANTIDKMESVVEPVTGATIRRLTDVTQDQINHVALYNAYSRYPVENANGQYVLAFVSNSTTSLIMDRNTGAIVATLAYDNTGLATHTIGAYHEVRWHYLMDHPYRVYYVRNQEFWMIDDVRNQSTTRTMIKDFSTLIDWTGTPPGAPRQIYMDQEGNSSLDSNEWAWMAAFYDGSHWQVRAFITYNVSTDTAHILYPSGLAGWTGAPANESARAWFSYKPNMVEMAPDGSGIVIGNARAYAGFQEEYITSFFEAPYFFPKDFNSATFQPFRLAADASHSGWSSKDGTWYYVFGDNRRDKWSATPISGPNKGYGNEGQLDVNIALSPGVIDFHSDGGIYPGYHFGVCTGDADGWAFVSTYALQSISSNGLANTLHMMKLVPEGSESVKWMVAPACNQPTATKNDYNEAPASINLAGTRLITAGDWNGVAAYYSGSISGYTGQRYVDMYEVALPDNWQNHFVPAVPVNTAVPTIAGAATQGQTLTRTSGGWTGFPTPTLSGNWQRDGVDISGATSPTYVLQAADVSKNIRYREIGTNASGTTSAYSTAIGPVASVAIPVNTVLPSITGTAQEGSTLIGSDGTWTNSPTGYVRQWLRDTTPISGATSSNYTLVSADVGHTVSYRVTASNGLGSGSPATSDPTATVSLSPGTITRVTQVTSADPSGSAELTRTTPTFVATAGNLLVVAISFGQTGGNSITSVTDTAGNTYTALSTGTTLSGGIPTVAQLWYCLSTAGSASNAVTVTQSGGSGGNSPTLDVTVLQYNTSSGSWSYASQNTGGTDYAPLPVTTGSFTIPANSVAVGHYASYYNNTLPIDSDGDTIAQTMESVGWQLERISANTVTGQTFTSGDSQSGGYSRIAWAVGVFTAA